MVGSSPCSNATDPARLSGLMVDRPISLTSIIARVVAGITPATTRAMIEVSEMGRSTIKPESLAGSVAFEQGDDPTISAHPVTPHEPLPAARKAAEKAEHLAKRKQQEAAIAKYREAVALDPAYFQAWNNLA